MRSPTLITGCARSGTSMTAGVIFLSGAKGGDMFGPTRFNPRGMYENKIIREGMVKPYLRSIGADPMGQKPLPDLQRVWADANCAETVGAWRSNIQALMRAQGVGEDEPWAYKGAKMCLFWPLWHAAFPDARWVLVRRTDTDIINSCLRTHFMRAYRDALGWQRWVETHKQRFQEMRNAFPMNIHEVWPEKVIGGAVEIYYNMLEWLGLVPPEDLIEKFIDPVLWGKRK